MSPGSVLHGLPSIDTASLLGPALIVILALAALVILSLIILGVVLLRRRKTPSEARPRADRARRLALARERRDGEGIPRRYRSAPRRWLVFGPEGHGKSGLLSRLGARSRRAPSPDLPRWWSAGRTIYLEAPPALLSEPSPDRRWLMRHLRRSGDSGLPLHGVIAVLDLRVLQGDPSLALALAETIRAQAASLADDADLEVPLVLALTHLDRLPGAAALALKGGVQDIIALGARPSKGGAPTLREALRDALALRQDDLLLNLLPDAYAGDTPSHAASMLRFHRALTDLAPSLQRLLQRLSTPAPLAAKTPLLAIALLDAADRSDAPSPLGLVLPQLSRATRRSRRARRRARMWSVLLALVVLSGTLFAHQRASGILRADAEALRSTLVLVESAAPLESLDPHTGEALAETAERWSAQRWGEAQTRPLGQAIDRYLDAAILTSYVDPSAARLARRIRDRVENPRRGSAQLDEEGFVGLRDDLEDYLRLTPSSPADPCASPPPPRALDVDDPAATLALLRRRPWPMSASSPRDEPLIAAARRLLDETEAGRVLGWILGDVERATGLSPIAARNLAPGRLLTPGDLMIRGAHTRRAWPLVHRTIDEHAAHARCWSADPEGFAAALREGYARRYNAAWSSFRDEVRVRRPRSLPDAHLILDGLLDPANAPLSRLQSLLKENTQGLEAPPSPLATIQRRLAASLEDPVADLADDSPADQAIRDARAIGETFAPVVAYGGLEAYYGHLTDLRRHLDAVADDPSKGDELREATLTAIADTRESILTASTDRRTRAQLRDLLLPPLEALLGHIAEDAGAHLRDAFCDRVARPMRGLLEDHYPWDPEATADISLRELDRLLNPKNGLLIGFLTEELQPWLVLEGSRLTPRAQGRGARLRISPDIARFFSAALAASDALYVDDVLQVDLSVTLSCTPAIHRVALSTGEATLHYTCASADEAPLRWPGEGELKGAWVEAHGRGGVVERRRRHGEWGLWRLLEETGERHQHGAATEVRIKLHEAGLGELPIVLRPVASHRPLLDAEELLAPLRDPDLMPPLRLFLDQERCADVR